MSHEIDYRVYKENVNKASVKAEIDHYVSMRDFEEGCQGLYNEIRWLDTIYDSEEDAYDAIRRLDNGCYDNLAVKFYDFSSVKPTKAMENLNNRIQELTKKFADYQRKESNLNNRKSDTCTCPKCKSRLSLAYLKGCRCPLCNTDLRSKTVIDRINANSQKISDLGKQYREMEKKLKKKAKVKWLVKFEYHM